MLKTACEMAFMAKNPHELLSCWGPVMSFCPQNLKPGPQHAFNHNSQFLINTEGFGSEFPIESPTQTLEHTNKYRMTIKHTIHNLFTGNIHLKCYPVFMFGIERREVEFRDVRKLPFDLLDVRWCHCFCSL